MNKTLPAPSADVLRALGVTLVAPGPAHHTSSPLTPLKTGGFKTVYAGKLDSTQEEVVVTVEVVQHCPRHFETHAVEQAITERIATEPPHPNVVALKAPPLERDGKLYMVLERCAQEVFDVLIDAGAPARGVGESTVRDYFVQAAAGLLHMHTLGVAHRDIKLENMLLTKAGVVKLIDFGLGHMAAVPASSDDLFDMASDRELGSRAYQAPEVREAAKGATRYDTRAADVWSLGVCLFALATGYWPLREASSNDWRFKKLIEAQAKGASSCETIFGWYKRSTSDMAPELRELIDCMLLVEPLARPTMKQVLEASWLQGAGNLILEAQPRYENEVTRARAPKAAPKTATDASERLYFQALVLDCADVAFDNVQRAEETQSPRSEEAQSPPLLEAPSPQDDDNDDDKNRGDLRQLFRGCHDKADEYYVLEKKESSSHSTFSSADSTHIKLSSYQSSSSSAGSGPPMICRQAFTL
jgi:serine/threonine protein kinase